MKTVISGNKAISDLWGKQSIRKDSMYRLMTYIIRVDFSNVILLHNVVTGQLIALDKDESELVDNLPAMYTDLMHSLVTEHFLVPLEYDEHKQVVNMRVVLRKLNDVRKKKQIDRYTILPTTACNARCYYCFEKHVKPLTMTEKVAEDVIKFISRNCGPEKEISINWFGGEPTVAAERIDQICNGLRSLGISYKSDIVTNGYLLNESMITRAKTIWNLEQVQISLDGTEINYNKIKRYVNANSNPYQQVLKNIGHLLDEGIRVNLRMNFDIDTYQDFDALLTELKSRFNNNSLLMIFPTPILGAHKNQDGEIHHADDQWMDQKSAELVERARDVGLNKRGVRLPWLEFEGCSATNDSYVIIEPLGTLGRCLECVDISQSVGSIYEGVTNYEMAQSWKRIADYEKCQTCALYPKCVKVFNCSSGDRCYKLDRMHQFEYSIRAAYSTYLRKGEC